MTIQKFIWGTSIMHLSVLINISLLRFSLSSMDNTPANLDFPLFKGLIGMMVQSGMAKISN